jgi:competence protein ComEC
MRRPLVYYGVSMFAGCLSTLLFMNSLFIGAAFAASFLALIILTVKRKYAVLIIGFFLLGSINYYFYFEKELSSEDYIKLRITEIKSSVGEGVVEGRKLKLSGNLKALEAGTAVYAKGDFNRKPDYQRGFIGEYGIKSYKKAENDFIQRMFRLRGRIYDKFHSSLGKKRAGIVSAACFGDTSRLEAEQRKSLNRLGIVHIVSVSGLHMSLVYKSLETFIGYRFAIGISFIYVLFTGAQASTVRAFIMVLVLKLSKQFYKKYDSLSALSLAALILLVWKPFYISDLGFMLSFLSVFGILTFFSKMKRVFYRLPSSVNDAVSLTLSAQSFSAPYAMFYTKTFSPGFALGNIFLLPVYSLLVLLGNTALIFINVEPVFGLLSYLINILLTAAEGGTYILSQLSPPVIYFSIIQTWSIIIMYISYMLYKKGKHGFLYLPLLMAFPVFFDCYKPFPEVCYINLYNHSSAVIRYKGDSVLILDKYGSYLRDMEHILGVQRVNRVELLDGEQCTVNLTSHCRIKIHRYFNSDRRSHFALEILTKDKKTLVTKQKIQDGSRFSSYDIIYLKDDPNRKTDTGGVKNIALIKIFFNRVYVMS